MCVRTFRPLRMLCGCDSLNFPTSSFLRCLWRTHCWFAKRAWSLQFSELSGRRLVTVASLIYFSPWPSKPVFLYIFYFYFTYLLLRLLIVLYIGFWSVVSSVKGRVRPFTLHWRCPDWSHRYYYSIFSLLFWALGLRTCTSRLLSHPSRVASLRPHPLFCFSPIINPLTSISSVSSWLEVLGTTTVYD
jgi:hypothetical protein